MQVKIGSGSGSGSGSGGVRMQFGGGALGSAMGPDNWIYVAGAIVLIIVVIALVVLIMREYNLQKKKKS